MRGVGARITKDRGRAHRQRPTRRICRASHCPCSWSGHSRTRSKRRATREEAVRNASNLALFVFPRDLIFGICPTQRCACHGRDACLLCSVAPHPLKNAILVGKLRKLSRQGPAAVREGVRLQVTETANKVGDESIFCTADVSPREAGLAKWASRLHGERLFEAARAEEVPTREARGCCKQGQTDGAA